MTARKKIIITNAVSLNGGDAAILLSILRGLKAVYGENFELVIFDSQPEVSAKYFSGLRFEYLFGECPTGQTGIGRFDFWIRKLHRIRRKLALKLLSNGNKGLGRLLLLRREQRAVCCYEEADLVLSTGGTYLTNNYSLESRFSEFELARVYDKPLILMTQSIEFINDLNTRSQLADLLNTAKEIFLRDGVSRENVINSGIDSEKISVCHDLVFMLADESKMAEKAFPNNELKVAVSVREWRFFNSKNSAEGMADFEQAIAGALTKILEGHDANVRFISTCQGVAEYHYDDSIVAGRIGKQLACTSQERVAIDRGYHSPSELISILREQDLLISTRMHMAILGLIAGIPVIPISYEFKTTELFSAFGLQEFVLDINEITADELYKRIEKAIGNKEKLRRQILDKLVEVRRSAEMPFAKLASYEGISLKTARQIQNA